MDHILGVGPMCFCLGAGEGVIRGGGNNFKYTPRIQMLVFEVEIMKCNLNICEETVGLMRLGGILSVRTDLHICVPVPWDPYIASVCRTSLFSDT